MYMHIPKKHELSDRDMKSAADESRKHDHESETTSTDLEQVQHTETNDWCGNSNNGIMFACISMCERSFPGFATCIRDIGVYATLEIAEAGMRPVGPEDMQSTCVTLLEAYREQAGPGLKVM